MIGTIFFISALILFVFGLLGMLTSDVENDKRRKRITFKPTLLVEKICISAFIIFAFTGLSLLVITLYYHVDKFQLKSISSEIEYDTSMLDNYAIDIQDKYNVTRDQLDHLADPNSEWFIGNYVEIPAGMLQVYIDKSKELAEKKVIYNDTLDDMEGFVDKMGFVADIYNLKEDLNGLDKYR